MTRVAVLIGHGSRASRGSEQPDRGSRGSDRGDRSNRIEGIEGIGIEGIGATVPDAMTVSDLTDVTLNTRGASVGLRHESAKNDIAKRFPVPCDLSLP